MADFDIIRDKTLLFFFEHLMEKGQPRTLHDLSCQFGAKGFTKEMRQIAGGSQSGLKKFLAEFPSLFTIEEDNVSVTRLTSNKNGTSARDYTQETIEFFSDKLITYGNAEVPLKSLFGHRSQASAEIRHVSGQNVKEFKEFLYEHRDIFVVREDYVVLKSVLDEFEKDGQKEFSLKRMPEEVSYDPYLMQQLVTELKETLFSLSDQYSNNISIELLFSTIESKKKLPPLWSNFVKLPSDLVTFLHMNSRVFYVQGNMVCLTNEKEQQREKKLQTETNDKQSHSYYASNVNLSSTKSSENIQQTNEEFKSSDQISESSQTHLSKPQILVSNSSSLPASKPASFNQRIRSQIIKIVSDNLQYESRNNNNNNNNNNNYNECKDLSNSTNNQPLNDTPYDSIDLQIIKPKIVVNNRECEEIVEDILKNCNEIAFDLEGINLGAPGDVTIIQVAFIYKNEFAQYSPENQNMIPRVYLFDVLLNQNLVDCGLRKLFESEKIVKIGHDVRNNSVTLYKNYGITLKNVFDTQVGHLILQQQSTGKPAYKPTKYISLYTLCNLYGGPHLNPKMKDKLHKIYRKDYKYWQRRPLTDEMIQFAMTDVYSLLPTVYRTMSDNIRTEYEPLFKQLVYESIFAYIHTEEIKQIKRQRKFELELTDLRMKLFNNDKKKIVLSNREIRLLRYIDLTEEIRNKIEGPQNVAKKLKRFDSKKNNENETLADSNENENEFAKEHRTDGNKLSAENKLTNKANNSGYELSDNDIDDIDFDTMEDDDELRLYEEELENESNSSSHEYAIDLVSNSTDDSLVADNNNKNGRTCCCSCHHHHQPTNHHYQHNQNNGFNSNRLAKSTNGKSSSNLLTVQSAIHARKRSTGGGGGGAGAESTTKTSCDMTTQTLSTGDIVITKIYFNDGETSANQPLAN